jgi:hypothetical protein
MSRTVVDTRIKANFGQEKNAGRMCPVQRISPGVIGEVIERPTVNETTAWLARCKKRSPYVSCVQCTDLPRRGAVGLGVGCYGM